MTAAFRPPPRRRRTVLPMVLPLLAFPALAFAQGSADPSSLGYESAVGSHRGFDDERLPPDGESAMEPAMGVPESGMGAGVEPVGDRPMPVDPDAVAPSTGRDGRLPVSGTPARGEAFGHDSVRDDYTAYESSDGPNWIGANGTVGEIGGWRTYARELYEPSATVEPGSPMSEPAMAAAEPGTAPGAKPAGKMPMAVDPDAAQRPAARDGTPTAPEPPQRARAPAFDSVLDDFTPYEEVDGPNWIEANGTVGEIGGWRTYARELYEPSGDEGDGE